MDQIQNFGKYHRTYCEVCEKRIEGKAPVIKCDTCDSRNITMGVYDRIEIIKDKKETKSPDFRPEYIYLSNTTNIYTRTWGKNNK